jgi:hypothetical protein
MKEPRKKWMLDPAISVPDLVGVLENYVRSQKTRELGKLLERAMGGHESARKVPKYESLFFVTSLCKKIAILAPNSVLPRKRLETAIEKCNVCQPLENLPAGGIEYAKTQVLRLDTDADEQISDAASVPILDQRAGFQTCI